MQGVPAPAKEKFQARHVADFKEGGKLTGLSDHQIKKYAAQKAKNKVAKRSRRTNRG